MHISNEYPFLDVRITVRSFRTSYRALVDTGFDGHLTLPISLAASLGIADSHAQWNLADGTPILLPEYRGGIEIAGLGITFMARIILMGEECLLGQEIIRQLKVTFDHGTQVVVET
jgi:clan AA aspartic protease